MDEEDLEPQRATAKVRNLDPMSIEQLHEYIAEMEAEIGRVRTEIAGKTTHLGAAELLFKK
ncbi:MAG: DUF1192 domain-containing protein [Alphaproteobacteria bacterium]